MKKEFIFVGDENNPKTKEWGLKNGSTYTIGFPIFPDKVVVYINTPNKGIVTCPYSSWEAFEANWK